jgi:YVTN family beta-propeller protein
MKRLSFVLSVLLIVSCETDKMDPWIITAPAGDLYVKIQKEGKTVLPNGRFIEPAGNTHVVAPHPYGLVLSPDGQTAVTANSGTNPLSITILRDITSINPEIQQIPPGQSTDEGVLASVFMGLAISNDNQVVYVAGGQENKIFMFNLNTGKAIGNINCAFIDQEHDYSDGYIGDMVLSNDGLTLYAVDQINFRMIIIDTRNKKILHNVPVGRYPFGITLSPDNKKAYVANVGMFAYQKIKGIDKDNLKDTGLKFPPFGYDTKEAEQGIKTDSIEIPGLGSVNAPEAFSVFAIDLDNSEDPIVSAKIKTGHLVGAMVEGIPAVGGSSPNSLVATEDYIFVSNGNNDNISVIDIKNDTIIHEIQLRPDQRIKSFRGIIPFGLALSPDHKRLYVAEAGINAVGVIDIKSFKVIGHIPTGWFPSKLKVTPDGKHLIVANAKGYGSGPNAGPDFDPFLFGSYIGNLMRGSVSVIPIPDDKNLKDLTNMVIDNNFKMLKASSSELEWRQNNPIPLYPGVNTSPIKHIVFISKENRTYDEVFGQVSKGKGFPEIARYGKDALIRYKGMKEAIEGVTVMPNHLQLAKEYAISDNFYVDADVSADGHRWLVNTYPNEWVETSTAASYGGNRSFKSDSKSPGIYAMNGSAGAIYPED